jgi:hypothetical protein
MKKIKYLFFAILLSIFLLPNVYAKESVYIKSITLDSSSANTSINSDPSFSGLNMKFDLGFKQVGDFAKYKVVIRNDSNTDYNISEDTSFNTSDYIKYTYEVENKLKAKSESIVYVTVKYNKEVNSSLLVNGKYIENNKAVVQLANKDGKIVNPKTSGVKVLGIVLSILLIGSLIVLGIVKKNNKLRNSIVLLLIMLLIPGVVNAIDTIKLTMTVKVEIESGYKVGYLFDTYVKETDKDQYDLRYAECSKTIYIGEQTNENKYLDCNNVILWDEKLYSPGERVNLNTQQDLYIDINEYDQNNNSNLCNNLGNNVYICSNEIAKRYNDLRYCSYSEEINNYLGHQVLDNDKDVMNFNNYYYDYWDSDRIFEVMAPQKFTMPTHNVVFLMSAGK